MGQNNAVNTVITNNADGFEISGGTTARKVTVTGGNVNLTGGGAAVITFPTVTSTLATLAANTFTGVQTFSTPIASTSVAAMTATVGGGVPTPPNIATQYLNGQGVFSTPGGAGSGDVVGPAASTDNAIARFSLATGKLIKNSGAILDDNGRIRLGGADGSAMFDVIGATTLVPGMRIQADAAAAVGFATFVAADSFTRFSFLANGEMKWGGGGVAGDTNLYRAAADSLRTNDALTVDLALTASTSIELGNATDTTLTRSAAGVLAVEGVVIPSISSINTLTNKRYTKRVGTTTSAASPTINTDTVDFYSLTAQGVDVLSFTTNLTGTPTDNQTLWIAITGTAARLITWGASFEASTVALPTTTVTTARLDVGFVWNTVTSKWRCVASA